MLKIFKNLRGTLEVKSTDMSTKVILLDGEVRYIAKSNGEIYRKTKSHSKDTSACSYVMTKNGYLKTCIFGKEEYVHRVIASLFCENKDNAQQLTIKMGISQTTDHQTLSG